MSLVGFLIPNAVRSTPPEGEIIAVFEMGNAPQYAFEDI